MNKVELKSQIWKHLEKLPVEMQKRVLDFTQALATTNPRGKEGSLLIAFSGIINKEEAAEIIDHINNACERIDDNEW